MRVARALAVLACLTPALTADFIAHATSQTNNQSSEPTVGQVLAKLDTYFETYRVALGELVADERMVQRTEGLQSLRATREIRSEVAFIDLPGGAGWLGFRDVLKVSNKAVRAPGPSLAETLIKGQAGNYEQARALLLASATHNLGEPRTTNLPNLPLEFLHQRNRWRYDTWVHGSGRIEGHRVIALVFEEKSSPSLIQRPEGGDILARVTAWVEPDGRLWRAHVRLTDARVIFAERHRPVDLQVDFAEHKELGLLVPDRMRETFYAGTRGSGTSDARYTNFRRFSTGGRIVPQ
jgi:hypothetical protein